MAVSLSAILAELLAFLITRVSLIVFSYLVQPTESPLSFQTHQFCPLVQIAMGRELSAARDYGVTLARSSGNSVTAWLERGNWLLLLEMHAEV